MMTIAELCLLGMVILTHAVLAGAKLAGRRDFDNACPRDPAFFAPAHRSRALWAHQNGMEAFPLFAAAVLLAEMRSAPQYLIDALAVAYLAMRAAYALCYVANRPTVRSITWTLAFAFNLAIFLLPTLVRR